MHSSASARTGQLCLPLQGSVKRSRPTQALRESERRQGMPSNWQVLRVHLPWYSSASARNSAASVSARCRGAACTQCMYGSHARDAALQGHARVRSGMLCALHVYRALLFTRAQGSVIRLTKMQAFWMKVRCGGKPRSRLHTRLTHNYTSILHMQEHFVHVLLRSC